MTRLKILNITFDRLTLKDALHQVIKWVEDSKEQHKIATPNPEILLKAQKDRNYREILNSTSLNIADGIGILWAAKYLSLVKTGDGIFSKYLKGMVTLGTLIFYPKFCRAILPERVTGTDLMNTIFIHYGQKPRHENPRIFLLGAADGVAQKVKEIAERSYENINIVGSYPGAPNEQEEPHILSILSAARPDILFVAFGAPEQEIWIHRNLKKIPSVKVAIGVGGAFDFISGKRQRAPLWMRRLGLEWLYRLIQEPIRLKRIFNATIRFPLEVIRKS